MKLTSIELHPSGSSEEVVLSFRDPGATNPFMVKGITGLDAEEIVPRQDPSTAFATDGSWNKLYSSSLLRREIVFKIGLNPIWGDNQSYSDLRDQIYRSILSSRTGLLNIEFKNGFTVVAGISGMVTKVESPQFERTQEVLISVRCDEPMLVSPEAIGVDVEGLDPDEFIVVDSLSTAPHGFVIAVDFLDDIDLFWMHGSDSDWSFIVQPEDGFVEGDNLYISSVYDNKQVYSIFDLSYLYKNDLIVPGSTWPIIFPGSNEFTIFGGATKVQITSIYYLPTYWGV